MSIPAAPGPDRYTVIIRNLVVMASIGIRRAERERKQRVRISIEMSATPAATFPGEDRRNVLNYEKVLTTVRHIVREGHVDLCEMLAERICAACFADRRVAHMRVTVEKLDVFLETESVGAILERNRPA
ncbi:MAG TPA: dihydroneopterin aldolase [Stellaceae bacterium]